LLIGIPTWEFIYLNYEQIFSRTTGQPIENGCLDSPSNRDALEMVGTRIAQMDSFTLFS
tara:strand:+ start:218 stop:394 length:177 start_codon:yes stop_codon:yes gene_type:complete